MLTILDNFGPFFLILFRKNTLQSTEGFCIAFSESKPFFGSIEINNPTIAELQIDNPP